MNYFTCNSCHYIFRSDDIPSSCPACSASSIVAQNDTGRKFKIPAVRVSTETEKEHSRLADTAGSAKNLSLNVLKAFPVIPLPIMNIIRP